MVILRAALAFVAGWGLMERAPWGRVVAIVAEVDALPLCRPPQHTEELSVVRLAEQFEGHVGRHGLDAGIDALVGEMEAAGVAQHVRVHRKVELGRHPKAGDQLAEAGRRERCTPLRG